MKTDVRLLIEALTTERNSIDRAISGLKAMSALRGEAAPVSKPRPRGRKKRHLLSRAERTQALTQIERGDTVAAVAREFKVHPMTLYKMRSRAVKNQNGTSANDVQPETNVSAIGVQ